MSKLLFNRLHFVGKHYGREIFAIFLLLVGVYFFRKERNELASLSEQLHAANTLWLFLGGMVTVLYVLLQAGMYVSSYKAVGTVITWPQAIELFLKRNFLSVFLPAGGVSSLAYLPSGLRKTIPGKTQSYQASALYAFIGVFTVLLVGVPLLGCLFFQSKRLNGAVEALIIVFTLLVVLYGCYQSFVKKGSLYKLLYKHFPQPVSKADEIFKARISTYHFCRATGYSLLIEACGMLHLFLAFKALGLPTSLQASGTAYIVSVLLMLISPFLRGLGAVELSMVYVLGIFDVSTVHALAVTVLYRLFEFWLPLIAGVVAFVWKGRHIFARLFPAMLVFALGLINILSVITPPIASRLRLLRSFIPLESIQQSNLLVLIIGMVLVVLSAFLIRGMRNAWIMAMLLAALSLVGHIFKALDYEEALLASAVLIVLAASKRQYRLKTPVFQVNLLMIVYLFSAVLLFNALGFYFLEPKAFGYDLSWWQSIKFSIRTFFLLSEGSLHASTRFGREFMRLSNALSFATWIFLVLLLSRAVLSHKKNLVPATGKNAELLLERYGNSAVDYFKTYKDKLLFFSSYYDGFIAYRIANGFAVVLEEPVCAEKDKVAVLQEFEEQCHKMGLKTAFYRVDESGISYFNQLKKRKLLIGQEAVLELSKFSLDGREKKSLRNALNSLSKKGYATIIYKAPLEQGIIAELKEVSDAWLEHYRRKEAVFSQGMFTASEIQQNDVIAIRNPDGKLVAFLNIIPDFAPGECTYDLIRKTQDAPGGCMDALIIELIHYAKQKNLCYLNMGLAPMTGIKAPDSTAEQLVHYAYERLKRFRHYSGLRGFKEKYASAWVNKYLVYEEDFDLLQLPAALNKVMKPVHLKL